MIWLVAAAWAAPVEGVVREHGTGDPLGDVVVATGAAQVVTGPDGRFVLDLPAGEVTLRVESLDHAPLDVVVTVPADVPVETVRVWLVPLEAPLEIVVESFRPTAQISRHRVDAEMAPETPGALDDAVRLVQALPAVTVQREYSPSAGDLSVRGSAPGDNRYLLDGVEIPYLYHYNQYASVLPTSQLAGLTLYPSTFGAAFGDAVGAVVDAETRAEAPTTVRGSVMANLLMAGADVRAPLGDGWWVSAAGRRSYLDLGGGASDQYTLWPIFHDYSLRAQKGDAEAHTAAFVWGAGDRYDRAAGELDLLDPVEAAATPSFAYRRGFDVAGIESRWGGDFRGRLVGAVVDDRLRGSLTSGGSERLRSTYLSSRLDVESAVAEPVGWAFGAELKAERTTLVVEDAGPEAVLVALEAPALARGVDVAARVHRARAAVYGEGRLGGGALRAFPGVRVEGDTLTDTLVADPRLALRWKVLDQTELELGGGRYHQSPETEQLVPATGDPDLPPTRAWEIGFGVEQTIEDRLEITVEGYRKWLGDVVVAAPDGPPASVPRGDAVGAELITRYRLREHIWCWAWVGVMRATVDMDGARASSPGDQPVAGGFVASWDPTRAWNLGLRYRYGAGLPYTPITGAVHDATEDRWLPVLGPTNGARMLPYHKVDLHLARTFELRSWSLVLALELGWVPRSAAQLYPTWSYDWSEQGWVTGPTLLPLLSARAVF